MRTNEPEPIEVYLDELLLSLRVPPRQARRILAEAEAHLRDTAEALSSAGMGPLDAEREAVRRHGSVDEVAASCHAVHGHSPLQVAASAGQALLCLAALALVAIGVSGGVAALMNAAGGAHFVGALPATYSRSVCSSYLHLHPSATSCQQAAMLETAQDAVALRVLTGAVGIVILGAALAWRRQLRGRGVRIAGIDEAAAGVAAVGFGGAAVLLLGQAVDLAVQHGSGGVGWYLSGGVIALAAFVPSAVLAYRGLRPIVARGLRPSLAAPA